MSNKGFTLIELLVVIAIIGILASIVLVTFPGAQDKAKDSRIISALAQARTSMVLIHDEDSAYTNLACSVLTDPCTCLNSDITPLCTDVAKNGGTFNVVVVGSAPNDLACISSPVNSGSGNFYCVDDSGVAKQTTAACVAATARCP